MDENPRCDRCIFWNVEDGKPSVAGGLGLCAKIPELWDATEWAEGADLDEVAYSDIVRLPIAEHADTLAFVQDGSDYKADLFTKPAFFCAHFTPSPP